MYVRHTKSLVKEYFERQNWYAPKYDEESEELADLEKTNIKLILYHEKE